MPYRIPRPWWLHCGSLFLHILEAKSTIQVLADPAPAEVPSWSPRGCLLPETRVDFPGSVHMNRIAVSLSHKATEA